MRGVALALALVAVAAAASQKWEIQSFWYQGSGGCQGNPDILVGMPVDTCTPSSCVSGIQIECASKPKWPKGGVVTKFYDGNGCSGAVSRYFWVQETCFGQENVECTNTEAIFSTCIDSKCSNCTVLERYETNVCVHDVNLGIYAYLSCSASGNAGATVGAVIGSLAGVAVLIIVGVIVYFKFWPKTRYSAIGDGSTAPPATVPTSTTP
eukprot:TRINITY_DN2985_c0_g2_i1.p2 TRINITY_DN2985_c0_g2~~TRINITY_DN2985_c0_g2_i1.p2  ORF type:complete len:209 (-),score=65.34 TRINITY_DN2985_c0_g2_i1:79-705(-)